MFTSHQIILCGILYWLAEANLPFVTLWTLQKPLVCGWAAGLVLGAPVQGAACGAILSVILLGFSSAGSSMSIDLGLAGITGAALTAAGWNPYAAVLPALLAGSAGKYIWKLRMRVNVRFARRVRTLLEEGKTTDILVPAIVLPALFAALVCLPLCAFLIFLCGAISGSKQIFIASTISVEEILTAAAGLLPAGGIALALSAAGHGTFFSWKYAADLKKRGVAPENPDGTDGDGLDPDEDDSGLKKPEESGIQPGRKDTGIRVRGPVLLESALLWLLLLHICYNNEWMMGQAMAVVFLPLARRLRPQDPEGQREILLRQSRYFNTHCECGACIPGLMASMEEQLASAQGETSERTETILMVRTSLMGVCGALGDTLFQKHLIPLLLLTGCLLTAVWPQHPAGPVLYTLWMTILSFAAGLYSFFTGYHSEPEQILVTLENPVFRTVENGMTVFLALLSIPAASLFARFPILKGQPAGAGMAGTLAGSYLPGSGGLFVGCVAAPVLTAVCMLFIRKLHWKKRRLYSMLIIAGVVICLLCG